MSVIDLRNVSFPLILEDLEALVKSKDSLTSWKDYYQTGLGSTLLELLAGLGTYLGTSTLLGRRELSPYTAKLRSSLVGMANVAGYPVNRVSSAQIVLTVDFGFTSTFWDRADRIGTWKGMDLVLSSSRTLGPGIVEFDVSVGVWRTVESEIGLEEIDTFDIGDVEVDNDIELVNLFLDDTLVDLVRSPDLLDSTNAFLVTTPKGTAVIFGDGVNGVDPNGGIVRVEYVRPLEVKVPKGGDSVRVVLNTSSISLGEDTILKVGHGFPTGKAFRVGVAKNSQNPSGLFTGSVVYLIKKDLDYFQLAQSFDDSIEGIAIDLLSTGWGTMILTPLQEVKNAEILLDSGGSLLSSKLSRGYNSADSAAKIALMIPGYYGSRRVMLTADDHARRVLEFSGSLVSGAASASLEEPGTVKISYLFEDEHTITIPESSQLLVFLEELKPVGENLIIEDPVRVGLTMTLTVVASHSAVTGGLDSKVEFTLLSKLYKLGESFHVGEFSREIGSLEGVYGVYIQSPTTDRVLDYNKYIGLDSLNLTITENRRTVVEITTTSEGYLDPTDSDIVVEDLPEDPTNLRIVEVLDLSVSLEWDDESAGTASFILERKLKSEGDPFFTLVANLGPGVVVYTDFGLEPTTSYVYRVKAYNDTGESGYAEFIEVRTSALLITPEVPTGLAVVPNAGYNSLSWTDNSDVETSFEIQRKAEFESDFSLYSYVAINVTVYQDGGVVGGTLYSYRVRAIGPGTSSGFSNVGSATTIGDSIPGINSVFYTLTPDPGIIINWTTGATSGNIEISRKLSTAPDTGYVVITTSVGFGSTSYTDLTVAGSTAYIYRVRSALTFPVRFSAWRVGAPVTSMPVRPTLPFDLFLDWVPGSTQLLYFSWNRDETSNHTVKYRIKNTPNYEWGSDIDVVNILALNNYYDFSPALTPLDANTEYEFTVQSYNVSGTYGFATPIAKTTPSAVLAGGPVTALNATDGVPGEVLLDWVNPGGWTNTGIVVWKSVPGTSYYDIVTTLGPAATSYNVTGLISGESYDFTVAGRDAVSYGPAEVISTTAP